MVRTVDLLPRVAEALLGRQLTEGEKQQLLDYFSQAVGSRHDRSTQGLRMITSLNSKDLKERAKSCEATENVGRSTIQWMV